jgi:hypothetical protein
MGKPEWKRPLDGPRRRWQDLGEIGWESVEWIQLAHDRDCEYGDEPSGSGRMELVLVS